jgi:hypothetical protein
VHHEVVVLVALLGDLERHVDEHCIDVHPPEELDFRVREEEFTNQWEFHQETGHLGVQDRHVVEDLDPVEPAAITPRSHIGKISSSHRVGSL